MMRISTPRAVLVSLENLGKSRSTRTHRETSALTLLYSRDILASLSGDESTRILSNRGQLVPCMESRAMAFCFWGRAIHNVRQLSHFTYPMVFSISVRHKQLTNISSVLNISQPLSIFLYNVRYNILYYHTCQWLSR